VIGHVGPEAAIGGPIGLLENGDKIIVDLNSNELNCEELSDRSIFNERKTRWDLEVKENNGTHPNVGNADTRLLNRMRCSAVSAVYGAGMHPNRELWVSSPRDPITADFSPENKFK
jgi:dihydroxy-acid dehydratase